MKTGTVAQLVAMLKEGQAALPGPTVRVLELTETWGVQVVWQDERVWLASTREPAKMRQFKTLAAACKAGRDLLADAGDCALYTVQVSME